MYDIIVLGGGPGGYAAALDGARAGLKTAVVERENLGGVCLNWGCIPTKSLLKSSSVYHSAIKGELYGIKAEGVTPDIAAMVARSRQIASDASKGIAFLMKKNGVDVIDGTGRILEKGKVEVNGETVLECRNIIIATGARPRHFDTIPVDGKNIIDSKGALTMDHIPESIVIVGSGAIGSEFATFFSELGSKVTLVEYAPHIAPLEDDEISSTIERSMRKNGIKTMVSTAVKNASVENGRCIVTVEGKKGEEVIESEMVLSAVGIAANIEGIGLEEAGVLTERGRIVVDGNFRTNIEGIYAVGDVIATVALAHVATKEGQTAVKNILGEKTEEIDYSIIPSCIFTSPEISSVGARERQLQEKGVEYFAGKFSFMASGKAAASGMKDGLVKLLFAKEDHRLLGAHLCGYGAAELVGECSLAIVSGATAEQIASTVHAHPTMHEAIMEAASSALLSIK